MPSAAHFGHHPSFSPLLVAVALLLAAFPYLRGWFHLRRTFLIPVWRVAAFLCGLLAVWIAVGSPLAALDEEFLSAHMMQHLLLMSVAAPLILLGAPSLLFRHGLPYLFSGVLRVRRLGNLVTTPVFTWLAATTVLIVWHTPAVFALGLESHWLHELEHLTFFVAGLLFWWPVIPRRLGVSECPQWWVVLYLFLATLPCDALSAFLVFCDRVVYTPYLSVPRSLDVSPLQDQAFAGALMWIFVTFAYLVPAVLLTTRLLSDSGAAGTNQISAQSREAVPQRLIPN
jgi:putative membrane protein